MQWFTMIISFQWLSLWHRILITTKTPSQLRLPQGDLECQHDMAARWLPSGRWQRSSEIAIRVTRVELRFEYVGVVHAGRGSSKRRGLRVALSRARISGAPRRQQVSPADRSAGFSYGEPCSGPGFQRALRFTAPLLPVPSALCAFCLVCLHLCYHTH